MTNIFLECKGVRKIRILTPEEKQKAYNKRQTIIKAVTTLVVSAVTALITIAIYGFLVTRLIK